MTVSSGARAGCPDCAAPGIHRHQLQQWNDCWLHNHDDCTMFISAGAPPGLRGGAELAIAGRRAGDAGATVAVGETVILNSLTSPLHP